MASNPIQKKVRNAMLVGVLITVLIMGSIVAFLLMKINTVQEEKKALIDSTVTVYTLSGNLESGDILTEDMLAQSKAKEEHIPDNAIRNDVALDQFRSYSLSDREGNRLFTDPMGMKFLKIGSDYTVVYKEEPKDENDKVKYYTYDSAGEKKEIILQNNEVILIEDFADKDEKNDELYIWRKTEDKKIVYIEEKTGNYFTYRKTAVEIRNQHGETIGYDYKREKVYVDILGTPYIAKIDLHKNTIVTSEMLAFGELLTDDIRKQEYNCVILPVDLTAGDYIDVRVMLPNGQDFVVLSKKRVDLPYINGMESENTIWMEMSEDEILTMSCAIVEAYRINGSKLYATKYTDPGYQNKADITYPISLEVKQLIQSDPNVTKKAQYGLEQRYTEALQGIREEYIHTEMEKTENNQQNVIEGINSSIANTKDERKKYLQSLANGY